MTDDIHRIYSLDDVDAYRPTPESAEKVLDRTLGFKRTYKKFVRMVNYLTGRLVNSMVKYRFKP